MTYVINKSVTFEHLLNTARFQEIKCTDPCHEHQSPIQYACGMEYRGHHVSVVIDGWCYSVEFDRKPATVQEGMSRAELILYVEQMTK